MSVIEREIKKKIFYPLLGVISCTTHLITLISGLRFQLKNVKLWKAVIPLLQQRNKLAKLKGG